MANSYTSFDNTVFIHWSDFKNIVTSKGLLIQYSETGYDYNVFALDGSLAYNCGLIKSGSVATSVFPADYPQSQNDIDVTDFETNFKSGSNQRISRTDRLGNPIITTFENAMAFGQIPNALCGVSAGYVGTQSTASVPIRATAYTPQGVGTQRSIVSTSPVDNVTGSGAQQVKITYLDTTLSQYKTEILGLSGTRAVNTVNTDIAYLEKLEVYRVGASAGNVGNVQLLTQITGSGVVWGSIAAGDNHTYWAHHYVLSGTTCYITNITAHSDRAPGHVSINVTGNPNLTSIPQQSIGSTYGHGCELISAQTGVLATGLTQLEHSFKFPLSRSGPDFIFMNERPITGSVATAYGSFEWVQF